MLCAARDGKIPKKAAAVKEFGEHSKKVLREIGLKEEEVNAEYPDDQLNYGIFLVCNHPLVFAQQAKASASWLISRN